jgi:hypothetical protein
MWRAITKPASNVGAKFDNQVIEKKQTALFPAAR